MGYAGIAMQIAGGGLQAVDEHQAGQQAKWQSEFNAKIADLQAADALDRGVSEASRRTQETGQLQGEQRVALAAQGIDPNEVGGTAEAIQSSAQAIGEREAATIRSSAIREAWGFKMDASNSRLRGGAAARAGDQAAVGTLINTGGSVYKSGYDSGYWGGKGMKVR